MSDNNRFNYYDLGPKVINSKAKYREEPQSKKLTYNFITDPRLRRGHNFGVIYVSNANYEEEQQGATGGAGGTGSGTNQISKKQTIERDSHILQQQNIPKYMSRKAMERAQYEQQAIRQDDGKIKDFGIATEKVTTTVMPKPISFEVEVQTDPLPPKEQEKLYWPPINPNEKGTQIEDNDLFNFDKEVEPLVQIIVSKTIEDSRREVLEEQEREEIKKSMLRYQQLNKEDAERVKQIEEAERKRFEDRKLKKEAKIKRVQLAKIFQKKLLCRTISKSYLGNLLKNTTGVLGEKGQFKNPEVDEYFTILLPELMKIVEENSVNDYKLAKGFEERMMENNRKKNIQAHRDAIRREKERREKEKQDFELKKKQEEEERQRKKEERARRRHERMLNELRKAIQEELLSGSEWTDEVMENIFNINGYYQKKKNVTCLGGPIGQIVIAINLLNRVCPDQVSDDKVTKIMDVYLPKAHPFTIVYKAEDIEEYKAIFADITDFTDIRNAEDPQWNKIAASVFEKHLKYDDMMPFVIDVAKNVMGFTNFEKIYKRIFNFLMKNFRNGTDNDNVRFIPMDASHEEVPLHAIVIVNGQIEKLQNNTEGTGNSPKNAKAGKKPKLVHETFFSEKTLLFPTISDKLKIIAINKNFDRIFRENLYECVDKLYKIEKEKEEYLPPINEEYEKFVNAMLIKLTEFYKKEALELTVALPKEGEEEGEEGEPQEEEKKE